MYFRCFRIEGDIIYVELMALRSILVGVTYLVATVLEVSTLLEVTEVSTINS